MVSVAVDEAFVEVPEIVAYLRQVPVRNLDQWKEAPEPDDSDDSDSDSDMKLVDWNLVVVYFVEEVMQVG